MISEIIMESVACFRGASILQTDKRINLVYGLNGSGKSTISEYLRSPSESSFSSCSKTHTEELPVLVYNQRYIQDNFYTSDRLKGIFSLSKENKEAEETIEKLTSEKARLQDTLNAQREEKSAKEKEIFDQKQLATNETWKIKSDYTGGDRVLEYCLDGLKGNKDRLFDHLVGIEKPASEPSKTIATIKEEVEALSASSADPLQMLDPITFSAAHVEIDSAFETAILGNTDSEVSSLIEMLGNSDWVKAGMPYIDPPTDTTPTQCPFCQNKTVTKSFLDSLNSFFDESYKKQVDHLSRLLSEYEHAIDLLPPLQAYTEHPYAHGKAELITAKHKAVITLLQTNTSAIKAKISAPKTAIKLQESKQEIDLLNEEIASINAEIAVHNKRLENKESALESLKQEFWAVIRWKYDQTISRHAADNQAGETALARIESNIQATTKSLRETTESIVIEQKNTINIDEAISAINENLSALGIDGLQIAKHKDSLYRIVRPGQTDHAFHTLSEGEKTVISFLYFCEQCKGKQSPDDSSDRKIAVIDDPISSLSHIYIFNIGQLIRSIFVENPNIAQIFIFTHSLYFFYEMTDTNHERRKKHQKLYRISKTPAGSTIQKMKYEEIQNDYQSYWSVINDASQPPALIANCMRNIVEYFFDFVRKKHLNEVFQLPSLQDSRYQAFNRYVNRESHSIGQNIIDMKEFNYDSFKEGLRLVFSETGYSEHFDEMAKL